MLYWIKITAPARPFQAYYVISSFKPLFHCIRRMDGAAILDEDEGSWMSRKISLSEGRKKEILQQVHIFGGGEPPIYVKQVTQTMDGHPSKHV